MWEAICKQISFNFKTIGMKFNEIIQTHRYKKKTLAKISVLKKKIMEKTDSKSKKSEFCSKKISTHKLHTFK